MIKKEKIVLLGDGAVGKTSLVRKYVLDEFDDRYKVTIGAKISKKTLEIRGNRLTLQIWDVLGQKGYTRVQKSCILGVTGAILVMDLTRSDTLGSLKDYWIPALRERAGSIPIILLANKADLTVDLTLSGMELNSLAKRNNMTIFLTSAKTGLNVNEGFHALGEELLMGGPKVRMAPPILNLDKRTTTTREAADLMMYEFCQGFGNRSHALFILRQQFTLADVNILEPTIEGLRRVVDMMTMVESRFMGMDEANMNRMRRKEILMQVE
jgi:small GTP-binding protein